MINTELALADLDTVEKAHLRATKAAKGQDKDAKGLLPVLDKVLPALNEGEPARSVELNDDERKVLKSLNLLTLKPTMYIANVDEGGFEDNALLDAVRELAEKENSSVVPICAKIESEIAELDDEEKADFLDDLGMDEPGLNRVIRAGFSLLGLQTYFTAGKKEVRAWTVKVGATAPQAAGVIHTDFEKGFIRAEVTAYDDYIEHNGEPAPRMPANGAWKARNTSSRTAMWCTSASTCKRHCTQHAKHAKKGRPRGGLFVFRC